MPEQKNIGLIKSVRLLNFIRYQNAIIDFKHGLTIITGPNGAGKSILIQAIQICLGASTIIFPNIKSLSDVIMEGEDEARISILINNPRINGKRIINFPPESKLYDMTNNSTFMINRIIKKNISYWKLNNRRIKRKDLKEITDFVRIDPSNEFIFMSQHTPDSLLKANEKDLFLTFIEATGITTYRDKLLSGKEKIINLEKEKNFWLEKLTTEESYLKKLEEQKARYKNKIDLILTLKNLKIESAWIPIVELERENNVLKNSLEYCREKIKKNKTILLNLINSFKNLTIVKNDIKEKYEKEKEELSETTVEYSDYKSLIESQKRKINKNLLKRDDREKKFNRLEKEIEIFKEKLSYNKEKKKSEDFRKINIQIREVEKEYTILQNKKYNLDKEKIQIDFEIDEIKKKEEIIKEKIDKLKKSGVTSLLSQDILKMLDEISKSENIINYIGPVCKEITIKTEYKKWSKAINASLRDINEDIIALDRKSFNLLNNERRKKKLDISLGFFDKEDIRSNFLDNSYKHPITTEVVDTLKGNHIALNYIYRHRNGLLAEFHDADKLLDLSKKYNKVIFTPDGYKYLPTKRSPKKGWIKEIIGVESKNFAVIKNFTTEIDNLTKLLIKKQKRKETFDTQLDVIVKRIKEKEKELKALRNSKDILANDDGLELESQLNKLQINYNNYLEELKEFDDKISDIKNKLNNFSEKFEFLSKNVNKKHRIIDDLINKQSKLDNELGILQNKINQLEGKLSIENDDINKYERKIGTISNEIKSLIQKTEKISARPKKIREKEMVIKLKTEAETLVSTIDIDENILELYKGQKKKVEKYSEEIDIRNLEISELNNVQKNLFSSYRNDLNLYLKVINLEFKKLIHPYFGEIRISEINKIEETSLHIFAAFDKNPLKITKLSAGQTALTIISFLISLQTLRKTPLKVIDEFTQRLDSSHQKQVINMIVDHFERIKNNNLEFYLPQFIIVTPEISNLKINYPFNHICVSSTPPILEYKRQSGV